MPRANANRGPSVADSTTALFEVPTITYAEAVLCMALQLFRVMCQLVTMRLSSSDLLCLHHTGSGSHRERESYRLSLPLVRLTMSDTAINR